jgi:ankyrin repeat protein
LEKVQQLLLNKDVSINYADYDKRTALHLACSEGHSQVVQVFIILFYFF